MAHIDDEMRRRAASARAEVRLESANRAVQVSSAAAGGITARSLRAASSAAVLATNGLREGRGSHAEAANLNREAARQAHAMGYPSSARDYENIAAYHDREHAAGVAAAAARMASQAASNSGTAGAHAQMAAGGASPSAGGAASSMGYNPQPRAAPTQIFHATAHGTSGHTTPADHAQHAAATGAGTSGGGGAHASSHIPGAVGHHPTYGPIMKGARGGAYVIHNGVKYYQKKHGGF